MVEQDVTQVQATVGDETSGHIVRLLGPATRVLMLDGTPELLAAFQAAGGQVALIGRYGRNTRDTTRYEGAIASANGEVDLDGALGDDRFEAIVLIRPEGWANPVVVLRALARYLQVGGRLIVAWRNPTHLGLRLALLHGRLDLDAQTVRDGVPSRLYTLREMEHLFAEAGYTVTRLDRQTDAWESEHIAQAYPAVSDTLLRELAQDTEAGTERFIAALQPRHQATPEHRAERLRETSSQQDTLPATVLEVRRAQAEYTVRLNSLEQGLDQTRQMLEGQTRRLDALATQVEAAVGGTGELRTLLLGAGGNGTFSAGEMQRTLSALLAPRRDPLPPTARADPHHYRLYHQVIHRIRGIARAVIPDGATVIVISKGDDELLRLGGKEGWHFPQLAHGVYAGFYPADGAAAIAHLEELRAAGGDFLLVPAPAMWWLERYPEFRHHLESRYPVVSRQPDTCVIFALHAAKSGA